MRRLRTWTALLLAAAVLLGTVPVFAAEPEEPRQAEPPELLTEEPEEAEDTEEETPAEKPEEAEDAEGPEEALSEDAGDEGAGDDPSVVTVTDSAGFRAALKNEDVKAIYFKDRIEIEALLTDADNHLEAKGKKILPLNGDYANNSLSFAEGVTLLQISPHEGNQAQAVEDQSISQIYGMQDGGPDIVHLARLVPGTVGWYEYHAKKEENPADEYAGMRVCYTMYFGRGTDAVHKAAELTEEHRNFTAAENGDDYRLVFTIFGEEVILKTPPTSGYDTIETDTMHIIPSPDAGNNNGLTVGDGGRLRINRQLEVWGDVMIGSGGCLDMSDEEITGAAPEGKVSFFIDGDLVVDPAGDIAFGTGESRAGRSVILGLPIPQPENLSCDGSYIPCLAAKREGNEYEGWISMNPSDKLAVTFALCKYKGGDAGEPANYTYTELGPDELSIPEPLKYEPIEGTWTLTAQDVQMGDRFQITCTGDNRETYTLPVRIENPELAGLPELGCYRKPEVSWDAYLEEGSFNPLAGASTFYVCVRDDAWFMDGESWSLPDTITARGVRYDENDDPIEAAGSVQCEPVEGRTGVWKVTVTEPLLHVGFEMILTSKGADETQTQAVEAKIWIQAAERLVYSETPLTGNSPDGSQENQILTENSALRDTLELKANTSADVVLYLLRYDEPEDGESRWICEYTPWDWAEGRDGIHLSRVPGPENELYTRVTDEGGGEGARIVRLHGKEISEGVHRPIPGSVRGEPLPVAVSGPDSGAPRLMVRWGGGDCGGEITMTPRDEHEVTFVLRKIKDAGGTGDGTETDPFQYIELDPAALVFPDQLRYEPMETHGGNRTLTAADTELGQRYQITYTADGETYTLPVRIELPDFGCYSVPEANLDFYLRDWQYTPVDVGEFYVCVNPDSWLMGDENWSLPDNITARGVRYDEDGTLKEVVADSVECARAKDEVGNVIPGVWKVKVKDFRMSAEFDIKLVWTEDPEHPPVGENEIPASGTGLWIDAAEQLVYSGGVLKGAPLDPGNPDDLSQVLTDSGRGQLHTLLSLTPGEYADVVLYLVRYDEPEDGESRWVCEYVSPECAQGREGAILSGIPEEGKELFARVTVLPECWGAHIVCLSGEWVPNNPENPDDGEHFEPDDENPRGIPLSIEAGGVEPGELCLMVDDHDGQYSGMLEITFCEDYEVAFALCVCTGVDEEGGRTYEPVKNITAGELAGGGLAAPPPLLLENRGGTLILTAKDADWYQVYPIPYTYEGKTYTLPVFIVPPELGCYSEPEVRQDAYLWDWQFDPLADINEFYVCVNPDAWFLHSENWEPSGTVTARGARYDEHGELKEVAADSVDCIPVEGVEGVWKLTVTRPNLNAEFEMELKRTGGGGEPSVLFSGTGLWIEAAQWLVFSEEPLAGSSPYEEDPDSPDRILTEAGKAALCGRLELVENTSRDVVLYLLVYDEERDAWICEHTNINWAEGRNGVTLMEAPENGLRVTASWPEGEVRPLIARLEGQRDAQGDYQPVPDSTRGISLPVVIYEPDPSAPRLMVRWSDGHLDAGITMTPLDEHEVAFVLHREDGSEDTVLGREDLDFGPLDYVKREEGPWVLTAENAEWNRTYSITYTEAGAMYTLPVRIELPELGCYSAPEASEEHYLREWVFDPMAGTNEFYVCVNPDAWFVRDGEWELAEDLGLKAWHDGEDENTDPSKRVACAPVSGKTGVWKVTAAEAALHVDFRMELRWTGEPAGDGEVPAENPRGAGIWIRPSENRLVWSGALLEGNPLDGADDLNQLLTEENKTRPQETLVLSLGAYKEVVLYQLVYDYEGQRWIWEYTDASWAGGEGVTLEQAEDSPFVRVIPGSESGETKISRWKGVEKEDGEYEPMIGTPQGIPLNVAVERIAQGTMEASAAERVTWERNGRTVSVSGALSQQSPLYIAEYGQDGRLIKVTACAAKRDVTVGLGTARCRLIWTDGTGAPRCESVCEYLI